MTKLVLHEGCGGGYLEVEEDFDAVMDKVQPIVAPSSSLEARGLHIYTKADGTGRVSLPPTSIAYVVEEHE